MHRLTKPYIGLLILIFITSGQTVISQETIFWSNIISTDTYCKYLVPTNDIGDAWSKNSFDDNAWIYAQSGIGYADEDDNTLLEKGSVYSVYIRYSFDITDSSKIEQVILDMDYDDGFIAYLNGTEIARANISDPISWNMSLERDHEALLHQGLLPERWIIDKSKCDLLIKNKDNLLAIEVHNVGPGSSDLSSNTFLHMAFSEEQSEYNDITSWFMPPVTLHSHLPIIIINTKGVAIPDEPKIQAEMGIIFTEGDTSSQFDVPNVYSGIIGIERRGESSAGFPKKQYAIETRTDSGTNLNVPLLDMPPENDWILNAPYSDKSMIKNVLTYTLSAQMGNYAPKTKYVELILDGDYKGVYVLMEKIKEDSGRVDIATLLPQDKSGDELTGGYIFRNDKTTDLLSEEYWDSPVQHPYGRLSQFQYYDPKYDGLVPEQRSYLKNHLKLYEEILVDNNFKDSLEGYRKYTNVQSFMDMMYINELSMNVDCYHFSTYFYKDKDSDGGKIYSGPVWDYNIAWGNVNYGDVNADDGFIYTRGGRMYWWKKMMEDPWYANAAYSRWDKLFSSVLSWENIEHIIDSCVTLMGPALDRNFDKWPSLGTYIWPNVVWPNTYEEEVTMLKTFIQDRLPWMNEQWGGKGIPVDYPPHLQCKEDQYLKPLVIDSYIVQGDELDPAFVWDDFDIASLSNNINGKSTLKNTYITDEQYITWTVTDSQGQQASCSFQVFISPDDVFSENISDYKLTCYPNPANDYFKIESNLPIQEIIITTLDGKTVHRQSSEGENLVQINTGNYPNGPYLVTIIGRNGFRICKLQLINK